MKTLVASAANIRHMLDESAGKFIPEIEVVLHTYEKLAVLPEFSTMRLAMDPTQAITLAEQLTEWAQEAERQFRLIKCNQTSIAVDEKEKL